MADRAQDAPRESWLEDRDAAAPLPDDGAIAAQRLMMVGAIAASVMHDVRNVLASIQGSATLLELTGADSLPDRLESIGEALKRGNALTRQVLDLALPADRTRRSVEVAALLARARPLLERLLPASVQISVQAPESPLSAVIEPSLAQHLLLGLAVHVAESIRGGGCLVVRTWNEDGAGETRDGRALAPGPYAVVEFSAVPPDRGSDQASELVHRDARPLPSLALPVARAIARREGGDVQSGEGASFRLLLPRAAG